MGIVYEAYDRAREESVALKALRRFDADLLYWLKAEFRALQGIRHPNLVRLGELAADGDSCFFTMELVRGTDFLSYVRGAATPLSDAEITADTIAAQALAPSTLADAETIAAQPLPRQARPTEPHAPAPPVAGASVDLPRLRSAMRQLASGLAFLHRAGRVHRDIKPSNVLVADDGRLVLLDFGLAADLENHLAGAHSAEVLGTPEYMAPEQARGERASPAADWYSAGVMLYQALAGHLPFAGTWGEILTAKQQAEAPTIVHPGAPEYAELCAALLSRNAEERPDAQQVLALTGGEEATPATPRAAYDGAFVGRRAEIADILSDVSATSARRCSVHVLAGPSGVGKTALAAACLRRLIREQNVTLLSARCFERESLPFKALDGIVDALSRHLLSLSSDIRADIIPAHAAPLARLFPVLRSVGGFPAPGPGGSAPTAELRARAFAALRDLLGRLASRAPLALYIDDLQWADADSYALIRSLIRPPDAPPIALLATYLLSDSDTSPIARALSLSVASHARIVPVSPLSPKDALALARELSPPPDESAASELHALAHDSGGHPLLLHELLRTRGPRGASSGLDLRGALAAQLRDLSAEARSALALLAAAGRPLSRETLAAATDLSSHALERVIDELDDRRLVYPLPIGGRPGLEIVHARVRAAAFEQIPPAAASTTHQRLARALETTAPTEAELIIRCFRKAGLPQQAAAHAERAARRAADALAFEQAARLYATALKLTVSKATSSLHEGLGDALVGLGRSVEASESYREAARSAAPHQRLELRRRAAEQLLMSGHIAEGLSLLDEVLVGVGIRRPRGPGSALLTLAAHAARSKLRGGPRGLPPPEMRLQLEACWSAWSGLTMTHPVEAAAFLPLHLELARALRDSGHLARALALQSSISGATTPRAAKSRSLAARARALVQEAGEPSSRAFVELIDAIRLFTAIEWRRCLARFSRARELYGGAPPTAFERNQLATTPLFAHGLLGEFRLVAENAPVALRDAEARDDRYCAAALATGLIPWLHLLEGDPAEGRRIAEDALAAWHHERMDVQHLWALLPRMASHLYEADGKRALELIDRAARPLARSQILRVHVLRVTFRHHRGSAAIAAAAERGASERRRLLSRARRDARALASEKVPWSRGLAHLLGAGIAAASGQPEIADRELCAAIDDLSRAEMSHLVAAARHRLGELRAGSEGDVLKARAARWAADQRATDPDALWRVWTPGF